MMKQLLEELRGAGIIAKRSLDDRVLSLVGGDARVQFNVAAQVRPPRPSDFSELRKKFAKLDSPLLLASYVSEAVGAALVNQGWSWADACGNWDIRGPGLRLQRRVASSPPAAGGRGLPIGGRGLALVRLLVHLPPDSISATELARRVGVSQPRASQVLKQLVGLELIENPSRFAWVVHREAILDRWLEEYRGPNGAAQYYYSLKSPNEAAAELFASLGRKDAAYVSGDVAADLIAPHKSPERLVVYRSSPWKRIPKGWVEAKGPQDSNITVVSPRDDSVATVVLERAFQNVTIKLADPTQILWDLQHAGGDDRLEGSEKLRKWILENHCAS